MKEASVDSGLLALSPLNLKTNPLLRKHLYAVPSQLSAYAVPSLVIWQDFFSYYWTIADECFCLFAKYDEHYYMPLPPMGNGFNPRAVMQSFALMERFNRNPAVTRIENVGPEAAPLFEALGFRVKLNTFEYLYRREALAGLHGDSYKSKRWAINSFLRHYRNSFEPYQARDLLPCMELFDEWRALREAKFKDAYYKALMEDAATAHFRVLEHHEGLGLIGRVVKIGGQVKGYTFGFELRPRLFCILLEVTDLGIKGLSQFMFWRFCRELDRYAYINVLDDSGLENIRRVKESYHPERLIPSYTVYRD